MFVVVSVAPLVFRAPSDPAVGPGCLVRPWAAARPLAVRAASCARRVVSKPGQAPPPPTSAAAWPCLEARPCPLVPPAPSTPAVPAVLVCPARPRRRPRPPQLTLTNFARNSPVTLSNLECASLELQRFQWLLKLTSNELRASFPGLAVYQDPRQPVGVIVRPGPRYRRTTPMCLGP